ncbi:hypothetical protein C8Q76DRAFT_262471 [Earliella scabrosa]|nr:hypothetical protein C8Q76DRAFT_262471 [Earliella scabrosa]
MKRRATSSPPGSRRRTPEPPEDFSQSQTGLDDMNPSAEMEDVQETRELTPRSPSPADAPSSDWQMDSKYLSVGDFVAEDGLLGITDAMARSVSAMRDFLLGYRKNIAQEQDLSPRLTNLAYHHLACSLDSLNGLLADTFRSGLHVNSATAGLQDKLERVTRELDDIKAAQQQPPAKTPDPAPSPTPRSRTPPGPSWAEVARSPSRASNDGSSSVQGPAKAATKRPRAPSTSSAPSTSPPPSDYYAKLRELRDYHLQVCGVELSYAELVETYQAVYGDPPPTSSRAPSRAPSRAASMAPSRITEPSRAPSRASEISRATPRTMASSVPPLRFDLASRLSSPGPAAPRRKKKKTRAQRKLPKKIYVHFSPPIPPDLRPLPGWLAERIKDRLAGAPEGDISRLDIEDSHFGTTGNLTLVFTSVPPDSAFPIIREALATACNVSQHSLTVSRHRFRVCFGFRGIQSIDDHDHDIDPQTAAAPLKASAAWSEYQGRITDIRWTVTDHRRPNNMLVVELTDDAQGTVERALKHKSILFSVGPVAPIVLDDKASLPQCTRCFTFGHFWRKCTLSYSICEVCAGEHTAKQHRQFTTCCQDRPANEACTHFRCANCGGPHPATHATCEFVQNRSDASWIYAHNANRPPRTERRGGEPSPQSRSREGPRSTAGPSQGRQVRFGPTTVVPLSPLSQSGRRRERGQTERGGGDVEMQT